MRRPLPRCPGLLFCHLFVLALLLGLCPARAQWSSESYSLVAGWNAIWLPVDASDRDLSAIFPITVEQVWQWNPAASSLGFTTSPSVPAPSDVQWHVWVNGSSTNTLTQLTGKQAYLIKVTDGTAPFSLSILGKPLPPSLPWKTSGVNLVGFPTVATGSPDFFSFFKLSAALKSGPEIFQYVGGPLSDVAPKNPVLVSQPASALVARHAAYWVQSTAYTDYYGPIGVTVTGHGIDFGDQLVSISVRLTNVTDPAQGRSITATLTPAASQTPPTGQTAVAGSVPLLLRGNFDPIKSLYAYTSLSSSFTTRSLAPGEYVDLVLSVDRTALGSTAGAVFQSLLQVTDSAGFANITLPVRAVASSLEGIWAGVAVVGSVNQIVGQTSTPANAPSNFPLRLLLHRTAAGVTTLLQEVYLGEDATGATVALSRAGVDGNTSIKPSMRLSSASFRRDLVVTGTGQLALAGSVSFNDTVGATEATNPFYHQYHPDHDNLDAKFQPLPAGAAQESYAVTRAITLTFTPPDPANFDPTAGSSTVSGTYGETVTGLRSQAISVAGSFTLHRIANPAVLLTQ